MNKLKQYLSNKPKWVQWLLGTNIGHMVINATLIFIFSQLAEYVSRKPFNTISVVLLFILVAQIAFWLIVGAVNAIKHD